MGIPEAGGVSCGVLRRPESGPALPFVDCMMLGKFFHPLSFSFLNWKMG